MSPRSVRSERELGTEVRAMIGAALAEESADTAGPFVEAVTFQHSHPLGIDPAEPATQRERRSARLVLEVLRASCGSQSERAAREAADLLASDPALHAAFFQNIDLLYEYRYAQADAVAAMVMRALEHLEPS